MKREVARASSVGWVDAILGGTGGAPWLWWLVALVVIIGLLLLGMRMLGLLPK
ncbi:MAG TPA: hypothetical protein VM370_08395 [Candidatus Thermoplasmatota archaeon]|nr:hypothetical protein [Candidatus Thermoplasmatota archaeon]